MTFPQSLRPLRIRFSLLVLLTTAIVLTQIPLFDYLGYEFSVVIALIMSVIGGGLTIRLLRREFGGREAITTEEFWKVSRDNLLAQLVLLCVPLLVITFNLIAVKNCSYVEGLGFYFLIPVVTALFSISLASLCFMLFRRAFLTYGLLLILILLRVVWLGYFNPQIFAYNVIVGYFPGFSYDEVLSITPRLIGFRAVTVVAAVCCFSLSLLLVRTVSLRDRFVTRSVKMLKQLLHGWDATKGVFAAATFVILVTWVFRSELGFESSHHMIDGILDRVVQTDHFTIRYASNSLSDEEIYRIAAEHEFQFHQTTQKLQTPVEKSIASYIYPSEEVKRQVVGAGATNIAKPWLREIHMNQESWRNVLKHEIVHVVAGEFAMPVIRAHYNIGLVEGLAMALEWDYGNRTLHEYAASMQYFGLMDDVAKALSVQGFVLQAPTVSYVLTGSFCRYLLDRYGVGRFKEVYGGRSFEGVYGKTLSTLVHEWKRFLRQIAVDDSWKAHVEFYFDRKPLFAKECARLIARLNENGYRELQRGDVARAAYYFDTSLRESWNTEGFSGLIRTLFRMRHYDTVIQLMKERMENNSSDVAHLLMLYGDAQWSQGDLPVALKTYEEIVYLDLSEALTEAASLRLAAVEDAELQDRLRPFFVGQSSDSAKMILLDSLLQQNPRPVIHLLKAQLWFKRSDYNAVVQSLDRVAKLPQRSLNGLREKLLGESNFSLRRFQQARIHFWQAMNYTSNEASRLRLNEWIDRCEWMENR